MSDKKNIQDQAEHLADTLISLMQLTNSDISTIELNQYQKNNKFYNAKITIKEIIINDEEE